jgi:hypothetical protein
MNFEMSCLELVCRKMGTNSGRPGADPGKENQAGVAKTAVQAAAAMLGG